MALLRLGALTSSLAYLAWRVAFTGSGAHPVLFVALLLAEAFGVARLWSELHSIGPVRPAVREPELREAAPTDVIVVVTDEPASEVRAAVVSAMSMKGLESLTIVDRAGRRDVAELAGRLSLRRIAGAMDGGDVGELLTAAMGTTSADFLMIVPADFVVLPDAVEATVAAFDDPEVGVVVGRSEATNAGHAVDIGGYGEQARRETLATPMLDDAHALPWWNGVSIVRREALEQIGAFAAGRLQATLATGVRLQVAGWRMADVPVIVGRRLAPWTDSRHLHRWSRDLHERLDLRRRPDISWSSTRLTPAMRRVYASAVIPALRALQRLMLLTVLVATATGAGLPLVANGALFIGFWSVRTGLGVAARWQATRPVGFTPWITTDLLLTCTDLAVAWRVLRRRDLDAELVDPAPGLRARTVLFVSLQVVLLGVLVVSVLTETPEGRIAMMATVASGSWLLATVVHARASLQLRQRRRGFRAQTDTPLLASHDDIWVLGVSALGVEVVSSELLEVGANRRLDFGLPHADGTTQRFTASAVVRRSALEHGRPVAFLRFALTTDEEMDRLIEYCAVVDGVRVLRGPDPELTMLPEHFAALALHDAEHSDDASGWAAGVQRRSRTATTPTKTSSPVLEAANASSELSNDAPSN